jgi:hypothetical protein
MHAAGLVKDLLRIGRTSDYAAIDSLSCAGQRKGIIDFSARFRDLWPEVSSWSASDRVAIAKAAAALEHTVGGIGSVTVLSLLLMNLPEDCEKEALDWILANTTSYAYYSHEANSWQQYKAARRGLKESRESRRSATERVERERAEQAKALRASRATLNLANAIRRGDSAAVSALLLAGASPMTLAPDGTDEPPRVSRRLLIESHAAKA